MLQLVLEFAQADYDATDALRRGDRGCTLNPNRRQAQKELFELVKRFASGVSLLPLFENLNHLRHAMATNRELRALAHDISNFIQQSLTEPSFVAHYDYFYFGARLICRARYILLEKYKKETHGAIESSQRVLDGLASDELTQQFGNYVKVLTHDLFLDE